MEKANSSNMDKINAYLSDQIDVGQDKTTLLINLTLQNMTNGTGSPECNNDYCMTDEDYLADVVNYVTPKSYEWFFAVIFFIVFVLGLTGNILVCYAIWRNKTMRTVTNIFIVNLAVGDLVVIIMCLPFTFIQDVTETWFFGQAMCKITLYLQVSK